MRVRGMCTSVYKHAFVNSQHSGYPDGCFGPSRLGRSWSNYKLEGRWHDARMAALFAHCVCLDCKLVVSEDGIVVTIEDGIVKMRSIKLLSRDWTENEIEQLMKDPAATAQRAESASADGVEIDGAHGHILTHLSKKGADYGS